MSRCRIPRCRNEGDVCWLGRWLCDRHWFKYGVSIKRLKAALGVK